MRKKLIYIFILLVLVNIVYSVPPFVQSTQGTSLTGLIIEVPQYEIIPLNSNFTFYFHVFNLTNSIFINDSNCTSHIYNYLTGKHILELDNIPLDGNKIDYEIEINDSFFNNPGTYFHLIQCSKETYGGFYSYQFKVGSSLYEATTSDAIINSILLIIFVILFISSVVLAFVVDGDNKFTLGDKGQPLVEINSGKYVKLFLYLISYLFLWMLSWLSWQIADKFLFLTTLTDILRMIFIIETILWTPLILIIVSIGLVKHFTDINLEKTTTRGLFPRK